jgi:hypothetical protein
MAEKKMMRRYPATCRSCGVVVEDRRRRGRGRGAPLCEACAAAVPPDPMATTRAVPVAHARVGAAPPRATERRSTGGPEEARELQPRTGTTPLRPADAPGPSRARTPGSSSAKRVGPDLDALQLHGIRALHDRHLPGLRSHLDHLAVGPSGVFVIQTVRARGRIQLRDVGRTGQRDERLFVAGRDRSRLMASVTDRRERLAELLRPTHPRVRVTPVLCFVHPELTAVARPFRFRGVTVTGPEALPNQVSAPGPLDPDQIDEVAALLTRRLRSA